VKTCLRGSLFMGLMACGDGTTPPTETTVTDPPILSTTLPVPPTFDLWICPMVPEEPRDAWVLRNVYTDVREQLASLDVLVTTNLDNKQHVDCPVSGDEVSCVEGSYVSFTGVYVTYKEVISVSAVGADRVEARVVDAILDSDSWTMDWHSEWEQTSRDDGSAETAEAWDLAWTGEPLTVLPPSSQLDATSFIAEGGDFPVDAVSWAWEDCAWSVLDQHRMTTDGQLYEVVVQGTDVDIERQDGRWLGYVDGECVAEIDSLSWVALGPC
jgi:hypothetical protein